MQATFVKLEEANRIHLIGLARKRGTTLSALIREAVFDRFNLTSDGPLGADTRINGAEAGVPVDQERGSEAGVTGGGL